MSFKSFGRRLLRVCVTTFPVRGRHRLVSMFAPYLADEPIVARVGSLRLELDTTSQAPRNMYYGIYEEHLVNWIARNVGPGDAIIEPGMNVGFITGHLLGRVGPSGMVISLEPSRRCVAALRRHNDLESISQLRMLNAAVADRDGTEGFCETPEIIQHGYGCLEAANWSRRTDGNSYEVPVHRVDTLMKQFGLSRVKFLKLDVEGSELRALRGAEDSLGRRLIDNIMVETYIDLDDPRSESMRAEIQILLESSGMRPSHITRSGSLRPFAIDPQGPRKFMTDVMWSL